MTTIDNAFTSGLHRPESDRPGPGGSVPGGRGTTRGELVSRAQALQPLIREHAAATERDGRLAAPVVEALREAGLLRLWAPRTHGGYEVDLSTAVEVARAIAEADAATGWVTMFANAHQFVVQALSQRSAPLAEELFRDDPDRIISNGAFPPGQFRRVPGGAVINARWEWCTGALHATHQLGAMIRTDDGGNPTETALALVPMDELTVVPDSWNAMAMRGTGSVTLVARDLFVPDDHMFPWERFLEPSPEAFEDAPIYRIAVMPMLAVVVVSALLGATARAMQLVLGKAPGRLVSGTVYTDQSASAAFHVAMGDALAHYRDAELQVLATVAELKDFAARGVVPEPARRTRLRAQVGHAGHRLRQTMDILMDLAGSSSFMEKNDLQRIWRDVHMGTRHVLLNRYVNLEVTGNLAARATNQVIAYI